MISASRLRAIYEAGAVISPLAGLEAVWDAAQTDILMGPQHHHRHPKPVTITVPDPCQPALFALTEPHHHHHHREHHHAE
jgi:hypothetical protein